jgi:hypothetical protein
MPSPEPNRNSRRLQSRQLDQTAEMWNRYKPEYERYLRPQPLTDDEEEEFVLSEGSAQAEQTSAGDDQTDPGSESASDERPTAPDEPTVPEVTEAIGESRADGSQEVSS